MILDSSPAVPPEVLPNSSFAIASGNGEFINGTRLDLRDGGLDRRCGTCISLRSLLRQGIQLSCQPSASRICKRHGNFAPLGKFDLLLGAAEQNLKIAYGETQISRFRGGAMLLRMEFFAFRKMKAI